LLENSLLECDNKLIEVELLARRDSIMESRCRNVKGDLPAVEYKIVSNRVLVHKGLEVNEIIIDYGEDALPNADRKLMWARQAFKLMEVDGRKNPICHYNYPSGDEVMEDVARRRVSEAFDRYWFENDAKG